MPRKATPPLKIEGRFFESGLKYAKELFGSENYQLYFHEQRIGFTCIASPAQIIEAWHAKANCTIQSLDSRKGIYMPSVDLERIMEFLEGEQFIHCTYWIVFDS